MNMFKTVVSGETPDPEPLAELNFKLEDDWSDGVRQRLFEAVDEQGLTESDMLSIRSSLFYLWDQGRQSRTLPGIPQYEKMLARREARERDLPTVSIGAEGSAQYGIPAITDVTADNAVESLKQTMRGMQGAKATHRSGSTIFWLFDQVRQTLS